MIRLIKNFFAKNSTKSQNADSPEMYIEELDYADLENNFNKRIYQFKLYESKLHKANPRLLNWIGSIEYSGYIREKCLKYLIDNYQAGDENRILLRLEDWVPQIQEIASQWVINNFDKLSIEQVDKNYKLILYLSRKERLKDSDAINHINQCLKQKVEILQDDEIYSLDSNFRRYLYTLITPGQSNLRRWLLFDKEPFNRLLIIKLLKYEQLKEGEREVLQRDKSTAIKRRYINYRIENGNIPKKEELTEFATDKSKSIRDLARYWLNKYYESDAYDIYINRKDDYFYYIADYAKKQDIKHFLEGIKSQNKRVRYLCLKAICRIDSGLLKEIDTKYLIIENSKFRKLITHNLPSILSIEELNEYKDILSTNVENGILIYLNMVYRKSIWHFIDSSLSLLIDNASEEILGFISESIYLKAQIFEKLPPELKISISEKIKILHKRSEKIILLNSKIELVFKKLISHIDFIIKDA